MHSPSFHISTPGELRLAGIALLSLYFSLSCSSWILNLMDFLFCSVQHQRSDLLSHCGCVGSVMDFSFASAVSFLCSLTPMVLIWGWLLWWEGTAGLLSPEVGSLNLYVWWLSIPQSIQFLHTNAETLLSSLPGSPVKLSASFLESSSNIVKHKNLGWTRFKFESNFISKIWKF